MANKDYREIPLKNTTRCFKVTVPKRSDPRVVCSYLVKMVDQQEDFIKERKILEETRHPNIVSYYGYFVSNVSYCLVFEYLSVSLKVCFQRKIWRCPQLVKSVTFQILEALSYLHEHDIIHRDISDSNVMISHHGKVKLIDFDCSKNVSRTGRPETTTGTPGFVCPEILQYDTENYEPRMDVFSLGLLAYLCYYGRSFYYGCRSESELYKHLIYKCGELRVKSDFESRDEQLFHVFLLSSLQIDPKLRLSAVELLQLGWFQEMDALKCKGELYRFTKEQLRKIF